MSSASPAPSVPAGAVAVALAASMPGTDVSGHAAPAARIRAVPDVPTARRGRLPALIEVPAKAVTASVAATIDAAVQLVCRFIACRSSLWWTDGGSGDQRAARNRASAGGSTASTIAAPEMAF